MSKVTKVLASVVLGTTVLAASISGQADSIKVGFNVPLTGFAAADGKSARIGAELAVEQVNASGGVNGKNLELVIYDDQASPKESAPLAAKLITQDGVVAGISGSYSGATRAAATISRKMLPPIFRHMRSILTLRDQGTMFLGRRLWAKYRDAPAPSWLAR